MPLIECRDCGAQVSDSAPACIRCGCPIAKAKVIPSRDELLTDLATSMSSVVASASPRRRNRFECKYCGSEDVKVLPLVVSEGTSKISSKTQSTGIGIGSGGLAVGGGFSSMSGNQQSSLASLVAAPKPTKADENPGKIGCLLGTFVTVILAWNVGSFWLFVLGAVATLVFSIILQTEAEKMAKELDKTSYVPAHVRWQRSFLCMRCMRITDPDA
jgi:hypothetical protein